MRLTLATFDPLKGTVDGRDIRILPEIAKRARRLLRDRDSEQVLAAQVIVADWVQDYLDVTFEEEVTRLRNHAQRGDSYALEFFETAIEYDDPSDRYGTVLIGDFKQYMIDNLDLLHRGNASEVEILMQCMDSEDMSSDQFPDGTDAEFLAALALKEVGLTIEALERFHDASEREHDKLAMALHLATERYIAAAGRQSGLPPPLSFDLQEAIARSIEAMQAVSFAESATSLAWLREQMIKKAHQAVEDALSAEEHKKKKTLLKMNEKSHERNRKKKKMVFDELDRRGIREKSAAKHAEEITLWMNSEQKVEIAYSTVYTYVRERGRELGIKW
ncbi:hypothetical protein [Caballeronia sp. LZ001]|uniref:hypothetical protein n=1 Tax=Caballeronia sp. LZ001 TaxID=3038553 RepID=UPI0028568B5C|nr:hypothetical protein [Caballeronia sp. LZ001]MDR5801609.1 hypothetical protein [Caballeronia sp. LZ001]